ncbi:MAG: c-type cytochrome [Parahaliea sp.]
MKKVLRCALAGTVALTGITLAPVAVSHFDDKEPLQSYRQSYWALVGANFGAMGAMVKGEIPWSDAQLKRYAEDLEALTELDLLRGFAPGSEKGKTRAKPEIWENMADFEQKFSDLQRAADALEEIVDDGGDRKAIAGAIGNVGKACKACHDDYKSKDYLY